MLEEQATRAHGIEQLLVARPRDVGDMVVARALPQASCRGVGPVVFLDHMGPFDAPKGRGFDVKPHPHIGLATVTYLFEGEVVHRDSLGFVQPIEPGAVNLMIAGHGIVHSERASAAGRREGLRLHGIQLWVALPKEDEACEPSFAHHPAERFPTIVLGDAGGPHARARVLLGEAWGRTSPVALSSRALFVVVELDAGASLEPPKVDDVALYVVEGEVTLGLGSAAPLSLVARSLAVREEGASPTLVAASSARVVLVGGAHLDGVRTRQPRLLDWNFVSSDRERLEAARERWIRREFPTIPGDSEERVPHPSERAGA